MGRDVGIFPWYIDVKGFPLTAIIRNCDISNYECPYLIDTDRIIQLLM